MGHFVEPVGTYMSCPVHWAEKEAPIATLAADMLSRGHSSVPVVDQGAVVGVISYTDLLEVGTRDAGARPHDSQLTLPDAPASRYMTENALCVDVGTTLRSAAKQMVQKRVHRVYVTAGKELVGVLSTKDLMRAVSDAEVNASVSEWMSAPVFTIRASEPVSLATERLGKAHVSGLVVVDDGGWPIGIYSQADAIAAKELPRSETVEKAMNSRVLVLPARTLTHRAAAQAAATSVRRVVAMERDEIVGVLTGLDFARVVAG